MLKLGAQKCKDIEYVTRIGRNAKIWCKYTHIGNNTYFKVKDK